MQTHATPDKKESENSMVTQMTTRDNSQAYSRKPPPIQFHADKEGSAKQLFPTNDGRDKNRFQFPAQLKASSTSENSPLQKKSSSNGLPVEVQAKMENSMGHDFSNVNIHQNSQSATDVGALAYAQGNNVHFAPGQFKPDTTSGQELIGHELAHVVQQREGRVKPTKMLGKGMAVNDDPALEKEADVMGRKAAQGKFKEKTGGVSQRKALGISQMQTDAPPTVTIGNVSSATSPAGMPHRIPPRVDTDVVVTVSGFSTQLANVVFSVIGANGTNGEVTIDGSANKVQNNDATLKLRGITQTAPGAVGNLQLVAKQGATQLASSNSFSVSSIPQNFTVSLDSIVNTGPKRGIVVRSVCESDSGNIADLNQAEHSESVSYPTKNGVFSAVRLRPHNSGYLGSNLAQIDTHDAGPVATLKNLKGNGAIIANQVFILWDKRTGVKDIPVKNSGFQITKALNYDALTSTTTLTTSKVGAAVTANGYTSAAGIGNVSRALIL